MRAITCIFIVQSSTELSRNEASFGHTVTQTLTKDTVMGVLYVFGGKDVDENAFGIFGENYYAVSL